MNTDNHLTCRTSPQVMVETDFTNLNEAARLYSCLKFKMHVLPSYQSIASTLNIFSPILFLDIGTKIKLSKDKISYTFAITFPAPLLGKKGI